LSVAVILINVSESRLIHLFRQLLYWQPGWTDIPFNFAYISGNKVKWPQCMSRTTQFPGSAGCVDGSSSAGCAEGGTPRVRGIGARLPVTSLHDPARWRGSSLAAVRCRHPPRAGGRQGRRPPGPAHARMEGPRAPASAGSGDRLPACCSLTAFLIKSFFLDLAWAHPLGRL
jgi:hypothetical protein